MKNQAGQALIEYILMLFIAVFVVGAAAQKIFPQVDSLVTDVMGTYLSCLLETGELPKLGDESGQDQGDCKIQSLASGQGSSTSPTSGKGTSGANGGSGDGSTPDKAKGSSPDNSPDSSSSSGASVAGGGAGTAGGAGSKFSLGKATAGQGSPGGDGDGAGGGGHIEIGGDGGGGAGFFGTSNRTSKEGGRFIAGGLSETDAAPIIAKKKREKGENKVALAAPEAGSTKSQQRMPFSAPEKKPKKDINIVGSGLDIGQIIKILLIAGIIIIFLVLIGGQALQLSKSWEKGE